MKKNSLLKEWLEHAVVSEMYGNEFVQVASDMLEELISRLNKLITNNPYISSKKIYKQILEEAEEILSEYEEELNELRKDHILSVSDFESEWLVDYGLELNHNYTIPAGLISSVLFFPKTDFEEFTSQEIDKIKNILSQSLKLAYITKQDTKAISEKLTKKSELFKRYQETDNRTMNTASFRAVDYMIFKANKQKVVYSSILDTNTCIICGEMNGKTFDIQNAPEVPVHERCRCTLIPAEAVEDEDIRSYSEFIDSLPDTDKRFALGKIRFELYEKGIKTSSFVNSGEIIPVKELKEKYSDQLTSN